MPVSENAGRANEPNLKELVSHTDDLKELLEGQVKALRQIVDERDQRYAQQFKSMDEKTSLALTSSEKAVSKAEIATEKRFDAVNEFRGQLKDQAATLLPRAEAETKFRSMEDKIEEIKKERLAQKQFDVRTVLSILALVASIAAMLLRK